MSKTQISTLIIIVTAVASIFFLSLIDQKDQTEYYPEEDQMSLVTISTSAGDIHLELDADNAPITVANFLKLAEDGYYTGTIFHRIIEGFMVQGGGLDENMTPKPTNTDPIQNEANNGLKNDRGSIAMARTMDPHSATGQFFINHKDNDFLNHTAETSQGWGYAVFGRVTLGMDVVEQIAAVETGNIGHHSDVPLEDVVLVKAERTQE